MTAHPTYSGTATVRYLPTGVSGEDRDFKSGITAQQRQRAQTRQQLLSAEHASHRAVIAERKARRKLKQQERDRLRTDRGTRRKLKLPKSSRALSAPVLG